METKKIKSSNRTFTIKKLTPLDFLEQDSVPFSIFTSDAQTTNAYDRIMTALNKQKEITRAESEKKLEIVAVVLGKGLIDPPVSIGSLIVDEVVSAVRLYAEILEFSLSRFKKAFKLTRNRAYMIDGMARRYGKTPIEIECPAGGYSELEAWMFNAFVFSVGYQHDIELEKKNGMRV